MNIEILSRKPWPDSRDFADGINTIAGRKGFRLRRHWEGSEMGEADPRWDWHPSIPTDIPGAPTLSITYDSLADMERIGSGGDADV